MPSLGAFVKGRSVFAAPPTSGFLLEDHDRQPRPGEEHRRDQAVVARADDDDVRLAVGSVTHGADIRDVGSRAACA